MATLCITGIDTDVGKSIATGLLARYLLRCGYSVITQKIAQTGCTGVSEDILLHRRLMGMGLQDVDQQGLTCPYIFTLPASPHLAANREHRTIEPEKIFQATRQLEEMYDYVLLEGVGGIYVPLHDTVTVLDYVAQHGYPLLLVSSAKLGSINHTLLTLDVAKQRHLHLLGIVYNLYPPENPLIVEDSQQVFKTALRRFDYHDVLISIPQIEMQDIPDIDFSNIFEP